MIKELDAIITDNTISEFPLTVNLLVRKAVRMKKKKKKKNVERNLLSFLEETSVSDDSDESDIKKSEELTWFKKSYLDTNLSCKSPESSEIFWKDRRKTHPNVLRFLCRYRSVACTSVFRFLKRVVSALLTKYIPAIENL